LWGVLAPAQGDFGALADSLADLDLLAEVSLAGMQGLSGALSPDGEDGVCNLARVGAAGTAALRREGELWRRTGRLSASVRAWLAARPGWLERVPPWALLIACACTPARYPCSAQRRLTLGALA
jgi:hypothetical protein